MNNLQVIEALCGLIDQQNQMILRLASALEEVNCLDQCNKDLIEQTKNLYDELIGDTD